MNISISGSKSDIIAINKGAFKSQLDNLYGNVKGNGPIFRSLYEYTYIC